MKIPEKVEETYEPSQNEVTLLEILLNPENRMKSITDICKLGKFSRDFYYRTMKKKDFKAYYKEMTRDLIHESVGPIVNAFIKEAKRGSFQHGRILLEMAEIYTEKTEIIGDQKLNVVFNIPRPKPKGD